MPEEAGAKPQGRAAPAARRPVPPKAPEGSASIRQQRARTIAIGGLPSEPAASKVAADMARAAGAVLSIQDPAPSLEVGKAHLEADGCSGHVILVEYRGVKEAMDAVRKLHHQPLGGASKGKGKGKKQGQEQEQGAPVRLWARQLGGEGAHVKRWRLIVRNLAFTVTEEDLRNAFASAGFVWEVKVPRTPDGKSRGFAFVGFLSRHEAEAGIALQNGKPIKVRLGGNLRASPLPSKPISATRRAVWWRWTGPLPRPTLKSWARTGLPRRRLRQGAWTRRTT